MIDIKELDEFKDAYLDLLKTKKNNVDDIYLSYKKSISNSIENYFNNLTLTFDLFFKAKENNDELAVQAALLRISTFLSGINGVLEQTREDVDRFIKIPDVAEFPDDYKIPEHYHYPIK